MRWSGENRAQLGRDCFGLFADLPPGEALDAPAEAAQSSVPPAVPTERRAQAVLLIAPGSRPAQPPSKAAVCGNPDPRGARNQPCCPGRLAIRANRDGETFDTCLRASPSPRTTVVAANLSRRRLTP